MGEIPIELTDFELKTLCKMGQGNACCRFILVHPEYGIICAKHSSMRFALNENVKNGLMTAISDNCEGKPWPK